MCTPGYLLFSGGSLAGKYYLRQFHLHWGEADSTGSEHTLDRVHYPMEAHFVHFLEGYDETNVGKVKGAIVVVAVMLQVDNKEDALQSLEDAIAATNSSDSEKIFTVRDSPMNFTDKKIELQEYSPSVMLPNDTTTFFRYEGSLTTPPCTEGVIWIVLAEPKNVLEEELNFLRQHVTTEGKRLGHNFREVQPLNGRTVYLNRMGNSGAFPTTIVVYLAIVIMAYYKLYAS
ncbi:carbonate dehydratase, eukaryotic-type [Oesophagostomum dentatum]|uniref:Carbonic anhydrase n=1 Tax=Oesophagostomum dentatum TaxID=61180 RepID=A0A0B1T7D6_OESDE|nr:carbonate dehydratase, eukaryotic-type [Oesophagostomum dentatum]